MRRGGGGHGKVAIDVPSVVALAAFALAWLVADLIRGVPAWVAGVYGVASVAAFALYAIDKRAAVGGRGRIRETTLLAIGVAGGWPGALVAQQAFRHKTVKRSFRAWFWLGAAANVAAFAATAAWLPRGTH